jgi:hypothetical protein
MRPRHSDLPTGPPAGYRRHQTEVIARKCKWI